MKTENDVKDLVELQSQLAKAIGYAIVNNTILVLSNKLRIIGYLQPATLRAEPGHECIHPSEEVIWLADKHVVIISEKAADFLSGRYEDSTGFEVGVTWENQLYPSSEVNWIMLNWKPAIYVM
jgi:hypothetical protein